MSDDESSVKKHNDARELELLAIRNLMKTEIGRDLMMRCLQNCCTFESIFNTDATKHAFSAGKRSHGVWLCDELREASEEDYFKMLREH